MVNVGDKVQIGRREFTVSEMLVGGDTIVMVCRKCGEDRRAERVRGVLSTKHECSAKCMSSTGTQCECSCAGKNHGGAYEAAS